MPLLPPASDPPSGNEREVFMAALELEDPRDRAVYLDRVCQGNPALRAAVESLLDCHRDDDFLEQPLVSVPRSQTTTGPHHGPSAGGSELLGPGDHVGPYQLLEQIGEGGVGTVFLAEQHEPVRRRVALKLIKAGMDTRAVIARFETERQALALMDHPNIAKVLDAGSTPTGRPYFVMELVRGPRLTTYCDENHLSTRQRLRLFIQVCQAIQHAHHKGIIHRDIKPSNILVAQNDGVPIPKVIDFGIAKAMDQRLTDKTVFTEFQAFIGTPAYMSPEQAQMNGLDIDTRTDIYSLGVLLYEMLTGQTPFNARELAASGLDGMRQTLREREPVAPSTRLRRMLETERTVVAGRHRLEPARLVSMLSGDLDWIVLKALEKDRTRRYATASSLAQDVQFHLDDEPITARPPSAIYRFQKLIRRNRFAVAASGAAAAALVLGLALASWQYLEKSAALLRVEHAELEQRALRIAAEKARTAESILRRQAEDHEFRARQRAYAADINLAQHALAADNLGRAQELLNRQIPGPGETDVRGWEWRFLARQCQSDAQAELPHESSEVTALDISSNGQWLASASSDGNLLLIDLRSRLEIARFNVGGRPQIAFSPTAPLLAFSAPADHSPTTPASLRSPTSQDRAPGPPRGPWEASPHRVRFWNPAERLFLEDWNLPATITSIAFATNGTRLAAACADGRVVLHDLATRTSTTSPPIPGLRGPSTTVQLSPDLSKVAYSSGPNLLRVAEVATGDMLWSTRAAEEILRAIAFSPDGRIIASGAGFAETSIRLWDALRGTELTRLEGHQGWVGALLFWPDGRRLASASADQTVRIWDLNGVLDDPADSASSAPAPAPVEEKHSRELSVLRGHHIEVWSLALGPDAGTLVSGSKDGSMLLWDATARHRKRPYTVLPGLVQSWRFDRDSRAILAGDQRGGVVRWSGDDFEQPTPWLQLGESYRAQTFSPDARFLVAAGPPGRPMRLWSLETRQPVPNEAIAAHPRFPLGFIPGSRHLLTRRFSDGSIEEWDAATGDLVRSLSSQPGFAGPGSLVLSQDAQWWLFAAFRGQTLLFHQTENFVVPVELAIGQPRAAAFSPDGKRFAVVGGSGSGEIWDAAPPKRTGIISGFLQGLSSVAFSDDGSRLVIGSDGREALKLWDPDNNLELLTLPAEGSGFQEPAFSPDKTILGARSARGSLHLWRAEPVQPPPLKQPNPEFLPQ